MSSSFSKCSVILCALVMLISVLAQPIDKKSDFNAFASAMSNANNAGRLRYGKRSSSEPVWAERDDSYNFYYPEQALIKRGLNADSLVASLNGAERLRFGRK